MLKNLVLYYSNSGRTEKIAMAIGDALEALVIQTSDFNISDFKQADIVGFGSGIYYSSHHKNILKLVKKLPEGKKKVFIFSTSGFGSTIFHKKLYSMFQKKGYEIIGELAIKGFDNYGVFRLVGGINRGHPDENDIKEAREFGKRLKNKR